MHVCLCVYVYAHVVVRSSAAFSRLSSTLGQASLFQASLSTRSTFPQYSSNTILSACAKENINTIPHTHTHKYIHTVYVVKHNSHQRPQIHINYHKLVLGQRILSHRLDYRLKTCQLTEPKICVVSICVTGRRPISRDEVGLQSRRKCSKRL